jgi:hypothetical protein
MKNGDEMFFGRTEKSGHQMLFGWRTENGKEDYNWFYVFF